MIMGNLLEKLRKAGLTGNEATLYFELLRRGSLSANDLSKKIGMDRTLTYQVLNHLIEKGLVHYVIKEKKKFFEAADPEGLLNPVKEKEAFIKDLVPQLKDVEKIKEVAQEINVYEGKEGLRTVMNMLLQAKSFSSFGATGKAYQALYELPRLAKSVSKKKLKRGRIITTKKYKDHPMTEIKGINFRFLDIKSEATTTIMGDKVAIHYVGERPIIIVIKNKIVADSYQNHFEVLWSVAKKR